MIIKSKFSIIILFFLILGLIGVLGLVIGIYNFTDVDERQKVDAIVVMGASQWNGVPSPIFENRLEHAYELYNQGLAKYFILTGGVGEKAIFSESQIGRDYLVDKGIASEDIFIEENSRTSLQSLVEVRRILSDNNFENIIIVSDGFHMKRLMKMTSDMDLNAYFSAVSKNSIGRLSEIKYVFREVVVYIIYLFMDI
ncbi:YdcF family protein [Patescibacteria group bacterium]|nr:YdcF family protein [Patescibacteria group bacterium]